MAFKRSQVGKCPICASKNDTQLSELNGALDPLLVKTKQSGELPKLTDKTLENLALEWKISPASLRYHLKECLLGEEIKDQRLIELKDAIEALQIMKQEFMAEPTPQNAYAYKAMVDQFLTLATSVEGQHDPEVTISFIAEMGLTPIAQTALVQAAEQLNALRNNLKDVIPITQHSIIDSQIKSTLRSVGSSLKETMRKALTDISGYYKVELEARDARRIIDRADDSVAQAERIATKDAKPFPSNVTKMKKKKLG